LLGDESVIALTFLDKQWKVHRVCMLLPGVTGKIVWLNKSSSIASSYITVSTYKKS